MKLLPLIILSITLFKSMVLLSCCGENSQQLIPIGQLDDKVIFVEFKFYRNCNEGVGHGPKNEFWMSGTTNLVSAGISDTLTLIKSIDTFKVTECICTYRDYYEKTQFESKLSESYKKALSYSEKLPNFDYVKPLSISFNDTINRTIVTDYTDTSHTNYVTYQDSLKLDLTDVQILSCAPHEIAIVRSYQTSNFEITVLRLRCDRIEETSIKYITKRFKQVETGFWKEMAQWHGLERDFQFIRKRD